MNNDVNTVNYKARKNCDCHILSASVVVNLWP